MPKTLPLLSRPLGETTNTAYQPVLNVHDSQSAFSSTRLVTVAPSATGLSSGANNNMSFEGSSWGSIPASVFSPSVLAPKPESASRRRLVPKKSKLGLLGVVSGKDKENKQATNQGMGLSDAEDRSFDYYVDPTNDPDIGEILMVKKKKSRAALDGMQWGPSGEVTNIPAASSCSAKNDKTKCAAQPQHSGLLRVKGEEKDKWWSIGRGRKDSKDKSVKEGTENKRRGSSRTRAKPPEPPVIPTRSKTPDPLKLCSESRARFNSLDSGTILKSATTLAPPVVPSSDAEPRVTFSRSGTPTAGGLLPPPPVPQANQNQNQNSIALRAMRSVRSLAHIGSWAQLRKESSGQDEKEKEIKTKESRKKGKDVDGKKEKKLKKSKDKGKKDKGKTITEKVSTSSFEVGGLGSPQDGSQTLGRKVSILGLGLPSSMRLPTLRGGSTSSSVVAAQTNANRLSVESGILSRGRSGSVLSNESSLRPMSTASSNSRVSSNSSGSSVRWDEEGLETVKQLRKKERLEKTKVEMTKEEKKSKKKEKEKKKNAESKSLLEGKKRTPLSDVFPEPGSRTSLASDEATPRQSSFKHGVHLLTVEETACDGHGGFDDELLDDGATPMKKARPRPLSEHLLGKNRPLPMYEDDEGVLSVLGAATDDLAQLIMTLNLEATPGNTPSATPLRSSPGTANTSSVDESTVRRLSAIPENPLQKTLRKGMRSISSLRPYAQSVRRTGPKSSLRRATSSLATEVPIGQQIAPWSKLLEGLSPKKQAPGSSPLKKLKSVSSSGTFRKGHRRQPTPAPEPEPAPAFQPLRPAVRPKNTISDMHAAAAAAATVATVTAPLPFEETSESSIELGRGAAFMRGAPSFNTFGARKPTKRVSLDPAETGKVRRVPETRRMLGMSGSLGAPDEADGSDPDPDMPNELQFILSNNTDGASIRSVPADDDDDTFSFPRPLDRRGSGPPPMIPLPIPVNVSAETSLGMDLRLPPVFQMRLVDEDERVDMDERVNPCEEDTFQSFDFTTELRKLSETAGSDRMSFVEQLENAFRTPPKIDLGFSFGSSHNVDQPPLPRLPFALTKDGEDEKEEPTMTTGTDPNSRGASIIDLCVPESHILNSREPTLLTSSNSLRSGTDDEESAVLNMSTTRSSRPSNGELNTSFKFGGLPKSSPANSEKEHHSLTLSDIIPPLSNAGSPAESAPSFAVLEETEYSMDSALKSIYAKAKNGAVQPQPRPRLNSNSSAKRRNRISARSYLAHSRRSSGLSFTGFDSFEEVRRGFEFSGQMPVFYPPTSAEAKISCQQRDSVLSMASVSSYGRVIDAGAADPFGFSLPSLRERPSSEDISSVTFSFSVDDTFSFMRRQSRRIRVDSDTSSFYFRPPLPNRSDDSRRESGISTSRPVSLCNKSSVNHSRSDSNTSTSEGRATWARHRRDPSLDSVINDLSTLKVNRPNLGDKMFDAPSCSSASSAEHDQSSRLLSPEYIRRSLCDSMMDVSSDEPKSSEDSLTGQRTSDSFFGVDSSRSCEGYQPQYRPISAISALSVRVPPKEDDTWISMIGDGYVRRHSVASAIQASPCVRVEKRKKAFHSMDYHEEESLSPKKPKIVKEPSIASTSAFTFGGERMIKPLEESVLIGEGEDSSISFGTMRVFSRPLPAGRSRSSTCTSSSGGDTPPLSADSSSISGGSQSSIDLGHLNSLLVNSACPMSNAGMTRTRARVRARGQGHRRRYSAARMSRNSIYETIEEEVTSGNSPSHTVTSFKSASPTTTRPIIVVDPDIGSMDLTSDGSFWDSERGFVALNKCYALRNEADDVVVESQKVWVDTPFSLYAVQSFYPPRNPEGMKTFLQHSVQNYGPLPSHLRPRRRSRTHSRPSPYPQSRVSKVFHAPEPKDSPSVDQRVDKSQTSLVLQEVPVNPNVPPSPAPSFKVFSPEKESVKRGAPFGQPAIRPRVGSTARRTALGGTKRNGRSSGGDQKENKENKENVGMGSAKSPGKSLRLNRPRPRGRPTPALQPPPIRI
ncbi:hypothetical protein APHAL10511_000345 [Amanita phalloides]|nr:hypothetical protein APHAL10511_000345 [Amanita phalloides]